MDQDRRLAAMLTVSDIHAAAATSLTRGVMDFLDGGAGQEITLRANEAEFDAVCLRPRILRDVSVVDLSASVLGSVIDIPILLAPVGIQRLFHDQGESASARAARAMGIGMVVSTGASISLEDIASIGPSVRWFQVYCYRDRGVTRSLVERAGAAGYGAICLTLDTQRSGQRLRNIRNRFTVPTHIRRMNLEGLSEGLATHIDLPTYARENYDASLSWKDLEWFSSVSDLPVVLKGVLDPEDARLAVEAGVAGIVVSNHGGRQLDGAPNTLAVLPKVADAVDSHIEVYLDGGIRRGTDVAKALALGARAVLVGRAYLWGLAVGGQAGVERALGILKSELTLTMALMGCASLRELAGRAEGGGLQEK